MEGFVRGDIIILEFPFSNLIQSKRRPSLIIKVPKGDDLIVCQITGKSYEASVEIPITKQDFYKGSLKVDSYLRLDKIFSIEKSLVKYKVGRLKQEKFNEILDKLCSFLKNSNAV
jgi:mRNA interferase MazF